MISKITLFWSFLWLFNPFFISFSPQSHTWHPPPIHEPQKRITSWRINDFFASFLNCRSFHRLWEGRRILYNLSLLGLEIPKCFPRLLIIGVELLGHIQKVPIKSAPLLERAQYGHKCLCQSKRYPLRICQHQPMCEVVLVVDVDELAGFCDEDVAVVPITQFC